MTILRRHRSPGGRARTRFALTVPAVAASLLVVASSGAQGLGAAPEAAIASGSAEVQTLTVDSSFVLTTMDPSRSLTPTYSIFASGVYQTLLKHTAEDPTPQPMLAESFVASDDATTYTFTLRDDVVFSDGSPLTSADVVFSFNRLKALDQGGSYLMAGLTVTAPDEYTVVITSDTPRPAIPAMMSTPGFVVFSEAMVRDAGGTDAEDAPETDAAETWFNENSAGSGPYVLESYATDNQIVMARNENYWGPAPEFDRIVIRNMPAATQLLNVQRGVNEVALDLSPAQSASLVDDEAVTVLTDASSAVFRVQMNMNPEASEITSNPHIQNAVRYGLNYNVIVQLAGEGAVRAAGLIPSTIPGHLPAEEAPQQDLERAQQEIEESGLEDLGVTLTYPSELNVNGLEFATIAQQVATDLQALGLDVELEALPVTPYLTEWAEGLMEMTVTYNMPDYLDPSYYTSFVPGESSDAVRAGWPTTDDQALIDLGAEINTTVDNETRYDLSQQLMRRFNEESPFIPLMQTAQTVVSSSNLTDVMLHQAWTLDVTAVGTK